MRRKLITKWTSLCVILVLREKAEDYSGGEGMDSWWAEGWGDGLVDEWKEKWACETWTAATHSLGLPLPPHLALQGNLGGLQFPHIQNGGNKHDDGAETHIFLFWWKLRAYICCTQHHLTQYWRCTLVQWVKLLSEVLTSHIGTSSSPGRSISNPAPS